MSLPLDSASAAEQLRRLTFITDNANEAYFLLDTTSRRFVYVNRVACEWLGFSEQELLSLSVPDINPTVDDARLTALLSRLQRERVPPYETIHQRKDGTLFPVEMSLTAAQFDGHMLVFAVARDLTERRRAQAALAEENRINDVLNRVGSQVAAELDRDRAAQLVTDAATELTTAQFGAFFYNVHTTGGDAYQLYTLSGVPKDAFARFPMPRNTKIFAPTFSGAGVVRSGDVRLDPRYGQTAPHFGMPKGHLPVRSYLAVPVKGRHGVVGGMFFGHSEPNVFTERHERLAVGLASWAALAIENARLYSQVKDALEEAGRANRVKDDFLAVLSHELRTPLNAIVGWVHVLRQGDPDGATTARALETIARNTHLQLQLIEDLLDVSAALTGGLHLQLETVSMGAVVQAATSAVQPAAAAKRITIVEDLGAFDSTVLGDARRLQQVVWNLLTNAVKFTAEGGQIRVRLARTADDVQVEVQDSGEGIDPAFLPHVFERFRQGDTSATRRHGGLGLGLALVRSFVQAHGGRVEANSEGRGLGTTFRVTLPAQPARAAAVEPRATRTVTTLRDVQVLVVDDDGDARETMVSMLQQAGASVRAVASAQEALEVLLAWRPRVVISDLAMPEVDGVQFLTALRARPAEHGGNLPVIGVTAYAALERREDARRAGFDRLLTKPVPPPVLLEAVESAAAVES